MIDRFYILLINSIYLEGLVPTISTLNFGLFCFKAQHPIRLKLDEIKGISLLLYLLMVRMVLKLTEQRQEPLSLIDNFNCGCLDALVRRSLTVGMPEMPKMPLSLS
jgi:hypothetical protein